MQTQPGVHSQRPDDQGWLHSRLHHEPRSQPLFCSILILVLVLVLVVLLLLLLFLLLFLLCFRIIIVIIASLLFRAAISAADTRRAIPEGDPAQARFYHMMHQSLTPPSPVHIPAMQC
eukprot:116721-Rhodomonas_salina.2